MLHLCDPPVEGTTNEECRRGGDRNGLAHHQVSIQAAASPLQGSTPRFGLFSRCCIRRWHKDRARRSLFFAIGRFECLLA
jgi:hypothetical protein